MEQAQIMKQSPDNFQLIAREEQSRDQWLAAKAAADIGSCIPHDKIELEERIALVNELINHLPMPELDLIKTRVTTKLQEWDAEVQDYIDSIPF